MKLQHYYQILVMLVFVNMYLFYNLS